VWPNPLNSALRVAVVVLIDAALGGCARHYERTRARTWHYDISPDDEGRAGRA